MKITVFGAAGEVGSRIVAEALNRGHNVTAVVRDQSQFSKLASGVRHCAADAAHTEEVALLAEPQDLLISAIRPPTGQESLLETITHSILKAAEQTNTRLLIVGGAASLRIPGEGETTVLSKAGFLPQEVIPIARACFAQYELCLANKKANWVYVSPPAMLLPGTRTSHYRLGTDELLIDEEGLSKISMEDFAVVLLDEAENPRHQRSRITAAY